MVKLETAIKTISQMINQELNCPLGWSVGDLESLKVAYFEMDSSQSVTLTLEPNGNVSFLYKNLKMNKQVSYTFLTNGSLMVNLNWKREGLYQLITEIFPSSNAVAFLLTLSRDVTNQNMKHKSA